MFKFKMGYKVAETTHAIKNALGHIDGLAMTHNNQVTELNSSIETPLKVTLVTGKAMITVVFCCQLDPSQLETW